MQFRFNVVVKSDDTGETSVIESLEISAKNHKQAVVEASKQVPSNKILIAVNPLCS